MNILAIDPGKKTGWACLIGGAVESGVEDLRPDMSESKEMVYFYFRSWLVSMIERLKGTGESEELLVIYERSFQRGSAAREMNAGFVTRIKEICTLQKIAYSHVHANSLKVFATGKGIASKEKMMEAAHQKFLDVKIKDDNHADALLVLAWAIKRHKKGDEKC